MTAQVDHEFELLLSNLSENSLTDEDAQALGRYIDSDSSLRERYLDYCQMHAMLRAEHGLLSSWGVPEDEQSAARLDGRFSNWPRRSLTVLFAIASLFAFVTVGTAIWTMPGIDEVAVIEPRPPYRGAPVARLTRHVGARFVYGPQGESIPSAGESMPQGTYELESGIIELLSNSGAQLVIEAPAVFTLADVQCVRMENGRLAAHVPKPAIGFRVETASATVVDLGTDFAVEAITGKNSEVHVFNGEVKINLHGSKANSATPLHLTTGKAARIDFSTGMPSGIDLDAQRFLRRLEIEPHDYTRRILGLKPAVYFPMLPSGDGSHLKDIGPDAAHAKINFGHATDPVWAPGKIGLAFALGGPRQQTYASADYYKQSEGDELSVTAWVMARSRPRWASIAKNWAGADVRGQFHFGLYEDTGELEVHIEDSSRTEIIVKDNVPLPLNQWHPVAFVADGRNLKLFRNGMLVDSKPYQKLQRDPRVRTLAIGTKLNLVGDAPDHSDFNMWDGRLDELAVFNHALTDQSVRELFRIANDEN